MRYLSWRHFALLVLVTLLMIMAGCGGDEDDQKLIRVQFQNLGQLSPGFEYTLWVDTAGRILFVDEFLPDSQGNADVTGFALVETLLNGDRMFVTIEPTQAPQPRVPSNTEVLSGFVQNNAVTLVFPRMQDFEDARGFVTASLDNRQVLAEYDNLPDVSSINFIYQGFLERNGTFTPLRTFNFNQTPVSDSANFDVTTAQYILTVRPILGIDPNLPYTIQPFFTNGPVQPLIRQQLVRSSLTPGQPNFRFPFGTATIR